MRLDRAVDYAMLLYDRATWPDGTLKVLHPLQVLADVSRTPDMSENMLCVAVLHDIIEDFPEYKTTFQVIAKDIAEELDILSRRPGEVYADYIDRICSSGNRNVMWIKLCDLRVNLRRTGLPASHRERYQQSTAKVIRAWLDTPDKDHLYEENET